MGFALVVVTNQSGIARGKFTEAQFETLTGGWTGRWRTAMSIWMVSIIAHIIRRVVLKSFAGLRLPQTTSGDVLSARDYLHIDMAASYMVGDKLEDMQAAAAASVRNKSAGAYG